MENIDMALGMNRLRSFTSWSYTGCPKPLALAVAGFYYTGEGDKTRCFSCEGEVSNWKPDMHPHVIHRARFPNCRLVKGKETQNRLSSASQENNSSKQTSSFDNNTTVKQRVNVQGMTNSYDEVIVIPVETQRNLLPGVGRESSTSVVLDVNNKNMRYEQARLESFSHWPKSDQIRPVDLAKAGLYFIGPGDRVQCAFCKGKLEGWIRGDNPLEEHRKHFGTRCRFMQGAQVGNVPLTHGETEARPQFPEYADVQRRLQSFNSWTSTNQQPRELAAAGFFSTGKYDTTKCYLCGGTLNDWQPNDDPWLEHARWFPHCNHVIQVKGVEFVKAVVSNMGGPAQVNSGISPTSSVDTIMGSKAAHAVLEMGLLRVDVEQAAQVWASRNNNRIPDANSLADLIMTIKGGLDENLPCEKSRSSPSTSIDPIVSSPVSQIAAPPEAIDNKQAKPKSTDFKQKMKHEDKCDPVQRMLKELSKTSATEEENTMFDDGVPMSWLVDSIMASAAAQMVRNMGLSDADILRAAHYWCRHHKRIPDANILAELALNLDDSDRDDQSSPCGDSWMTSSKPLTSKIASSGDQSSATPHASSDNHSSPRSDTVPYNNEKKKKSLRRNVKKHTTIDSVEAKEITLTEQVQQLKRQVNDLQNQRLCKVCQDEEINMAFLPCGHLVCCDICSQAVSQCPICRMRKVDSQE